MTNVPFQRVLGENNYQWVNNFAERGASFKKVSCLYHIQNNGMSRFGYFELFKQIIARIYFPNIHIKVLYDLLLSDTSDASLPLPSVDQFTKVKKVTAIWLVP